MSTPSRNQNPRSTNMATAANRQSLLLPPNPTVIRRKRQEHTISHILDSAAPVPPPATKPSTNAVPPASICTSESHSRNHSKSTIMGVIQAGYLDSISENQKIDMADEPGSNAPGSVPFPSSGASSSTDSVPGSPPPPEPEAEGRDSPVLSTKSSNHFSAFSDDGGRYPPDSIPKQSSSKNPHFVQRSVGGKFAGSHRRQGAVNWAGITPVPLRRAERSRNRRPRPGRLTVRERLEPTLQLALIARDEAAKKARNTGFAFTAAIAAQVIFGSLTTGLSAALSGRQVSNATAALGALSTIAATYLARTRGSNEPDTSITRTRDLDYFIRECQAFQLDYGHLYGVDRVAAESESESDSEYEFSVMEGTAMERWLDMKLEELRCKFEDMVGNGNIGARADRTLPGSHEHPPSASTVMLQKSAV